MKVALLREVFVNGEQSDILNSLVAYCGQAKAQGATLVVLPELALNSWAPIATQVQREEDAETENGWRQALFARAAKDSGVYLLGGVILLKEGVRNNVTMLWNPEGEVVYRYHKLHLPNEPGFYEPAHYDPASVCPGVVSLKDNNDETWVIGAQVCSDIMRPHGTSSVQAALGAQLILAPRATEADTVDIWRTVMTANALTSAVYVLSVPRPRPENEVPLGGPSIVIAPNGKVLAESEETLLVVGVEMEAVKSARKGYPGYLTVRPELYAKSWAGATQTI
eukprot:GILJ01001644.1.p1 GENE.GILJ01001644.1~~GILJ01001644.1.p1  ORF type:complete len:294 (-),score=33.42 GILJ01001644.1:70-909(-)